jgi:hypothetical protein
MQDTQDIIADLNATLYIQQGQIQILIAIITAEIGKEKFKEHISSVLESDLFLESSKLFAREWMKTSYARGV